MRDLLGKAYARHVVVLCPASGALLIRWRHYDAEDFGHVREGIRIPRLIIPDENCRADSSV